MKFVIYGENVTITDDASVNPQPTDLICYTSFDTSGNLVFNTPFPAKASGLFTFEYIITYDDGTTASLSSMNISAPETMSVSTILSGKENQNFKLSLYVTNLNYNYRARIGAYNFVGTTGNFSVEIEDINYAFYYVGGLAD